MRTLAAVALIALFGSSACTGGPESGRAETTQWAADVNGCGWAMLGGWGSQAHGVITNATTSQHDYRIAVDFRDRAGVRLGQGVAIVRAVAGGDTARWEATTTGADAPDGMECPVTKVDQY